MTVLDDRPELEDVDADAGCETCGTPLRRPGQRFCSMACETAAHAGPGRRTSNGTHPEPEPVPVHQVCALDGCGQPVSSGRGARFCCQQHRRRAAHLRAQKTETEPVSVRHSSEPVGLPGDVFEVLQGLPLLLRSGWTVRATVDTVTLAWSR